jgi:hypothetical protein
MMDKLERWLGLGTLLIVTLGTYAVAPRACLDCSPQQKSTEPFKTTDIHQESEPDLPQDKLDGKPESETERNDRLAKYLTGTQWTGKFTTTGEEAKPAAEEKYEIIEAKKADDQDSWNLVARIQYGGKDVTLPLPTMEIKWAGETPVITVDKMVIPGMGTFDARVLIRKGQYAGTWAHGKVGGHLFGKIEKIQLTEPKEEN